MYKNIAFIPVRGGSKSIPMKNIKKINGRPLIYWALDAAKNCNNIEKIIVSTDSDEIKNIVKLYDSKKVEVVSRSIETATDYASTESAMLEFANNYDFDNIVLIQATSPLISSKDLDNGFDEFFKEDIDSVLSVVEQKRFIWSKESSSYRPLNYEPNNRPRRQDFDGMLIENGAFYITSKERLLKSRCRISGNISCIKMDESSYFEIDNPSDWVIVEDLLKLNNAKARKTKIKMLLTDSDGVLTDGGMYYSENGDELKKFNTKDGMAFELLRNKGIKTGIITGEDRELVRRRGLKLKVDELHMGIKNKMEIIDYICDKYKISYDEIAYIGDDINDLDVIKIVGLGCCVNDGMSIVKKSANYITKVNGGEGAVREVAEKILLEN